MKNVQGKVVIITGAGTGLGRELAHLFAAQGAKVSVCGRRISKMTQLQDELAAYRDRLLAVAADVSDERDAMRVVNQTKERFGRVDILINNAAVYESASVVETSLDSWNYHFNNNVTSAFLMSKACVPIMRAQKSGQIINLTSSLAATGANGFGAYSASKAAVETLTYTIDEEEAGNGIIANVVNPGVMKTEMHTKGIAPRDAALHLLKFIEVERTIGSSVVNLDELYNTEYYI